MIKNSINKILCDVVRYECLVGLEILKYEFWPFLQQMKKKSYNGHNFCIRRRKNANNTLKKTRENSGVSAGTSGPRSKNCPQWLEKLETYLRGHLPQWFPCFGASLTPPLLTSKALISLNPSNDSCPNLGIQERRSRSRTRPITFSSKWGEPCGSSSWSSFVVLLFVLPLLFPPMHLLLSWNLRVKDLSTCVLAICITLVGNSL